MPLIVNLRHLAERPVRLQGQLPVADLDLGIKDELIQTNQPLDYDIEVDKIEGGLLARGRLQLTLDCQCVRCLKPFPLALELEDWSAHLPLDGEDAVPVNGDLVDLTAQLREDILLDFPQHPLCNPGCGGLPKAGPGGAKKPGEFTQPDGQSSAWSELNKLKF